MPRDSHARWAVRPGLRRACYGLLCAAAAVALGCGEPAESDPSMTVPADDDDDAPVDDDDDDHADDDGDDAPDDNDSGGS